MNRKSFYYHFKDKYDLVNWIYDTEFLTIAQKKEYQAGWDLLEDMCAYFYDNRQFYRKIFRIDGQNSFSNYFRDTVMLIISKDMAEIFSQEKHMDFFVHFYTDAFVCAIKRWLLQQNHLSAAEFSQLLKKCLIGTSNKILQDFTASTPSG